MGTYRSQQRDPRKKRAAADPLADLAGVELDARRAQRLATVDAFQRGRTPLTVIALAERATGFADETVAQVMAKHPPPHLACQEGCDWCCYLVVGTAVPEVIRIVEYMRKSFSEDELRATRQRIVALDEQKRQRIATRGADATPLATRAPLPCPLLVNHRCSVYPVRPLTCRGCNSRDARQCELFLDPKNKAVVPAYVPQHRLMTFVLDGLRAGAAESGLNGDLVELTAALRIAFEVPDAAERWLAGEAVFAPARLN